MSMFCLFDFGDSLETALFYVAYSKYKSVVCTRMTKYNGISMDINSKHLYYDYCYYYCYDGVSTLITFFNSNYD